MTDRVFEITKAATFDAAHHLNLGPADNRYRRLHGHSFRVEATVRGPVSASEGWVADLAELDAALKAIASDLDHGLLNEKPGHWKTPTARKPVRLFRGPAEARLSEPSPHRAVRGPPWARAARSISERQPSFGSSFFFFFFLGATA